jgi:hypothetical protein
MAILSEERREQGNPEQGHTEGGSQGSESTERAAHKGCFPTLEAAKQVTPPSTKFRLFVVTDPACEERYSWAWTGDAAISNVARADGWKARVAEPKGAAPMTKERIAARLSEFSDEELAAMGLKRASQKGKK